MHRLEKAIKSEDEDEFGTEESFEFSNSEVWKESDSEVDSVVNLTEVEDKLSRFLSVKCKLMLTVAWIEKRHSN